MNTRNQVRIIRLVLAAMGVGTTFLAAQGGGAAGGAGRGGRGGTGAPGAVAQAPATVWPDTMFGLTEYTMAREKVEKLIKPGGYPVMIINDMEGLAGVVNNGREMSVGRGGSSPDHQRFRQELTDETNAAIAGARAAGATQFFVVEGHGANNWHNILVEKLDPEAILLSGWPRPNAMETGVTSKLKAILIVGNHPNAGTPGIIAHAYAFGSSLTVNGRKLNESGISAFVAGEYGVPVALGAGDDSYVAEMPGMIGGPLELVTVKIALSGSGGAMMPLARVHAQIKAAATRAIMRVKAGEIKPTTFTKPYHVAFCLRGNAQMPIDKDVLTYEGVTWDSAGGARCFNMVTSSAEKVTTLLNLIEWASLKP